MVSQKHVKNFDHSLDTGLYRVKISRFNCKVDHVGVPGILIPRKSWKNEAFKRQKTNKWSIKMEVIVRSYFVERLFKNVSKSAGKQIY